MLIKLLQLRPKLAWKRFYASATEAENAGEVGVTMALRVPLQNNADRDMEYLDMAIRDMERAPTDWSLVAEDLGSGYYGISVWRVPPTSFIWEVTA